MSHTIGDQARWWAGRTDIGDFDDWELWALGEFRGRLAVTEATMQQILDKLNYTPSAGPIKLSITGPIDWGRLKMA